MRSNYGISPKKMKVELSLSESHLPAPLPPLTVHLAGKWCANKFWIFFFFFLKTLETAANRVIKSEPEQQSYRKM